MDDHHPKELSDMKRHDLPNADEWQLAAANTIERLQRELADTVDMLQQCADRTRS